MKSLVICLLSVLAVLMSTAADVAEGNTDLPVSTLASDNAVKPSWRHIGLMPETCFDVNQAVSNRIMSIDGAIALEPDPVCSVVYEGGTPYIRINGRNHEPNLNLAGAKSSFALTANIKTHSLSFPFHELQFDANEFEIAPGKYDFTAFDVEAHRLLHFIPDAYIFLRFTIDLPKWCAIHPEECIGYGKGRHPGDEYLGTPVRPSAASCPYREEVSRLIDQLGAYVRTRPWAKRVVAFRPCWGVYTEWHTYGMYNAPDVGAAMMAAFHRFKGGRYAGQPPPTLEERCSGGYLLDPVRDAKTLDYHRCMSDETTDLLLLTMRDVKRNFPDRLVGCYNGYVYNSFPPEGQNCRYDRVLSSPDVDFCSNPAAYAPHVIRSPGGSYMQRAVADAFRRHGKLLFLEDDMRFHHVREWDVRQYCTQTPEESAAVMRRNWLVKYMDGSGIQLCDPFKGTGRRTNTFDDPAILGAIHDAMNAIAKAGNISAESGNDALVLVDVAQRFRWSGSSTAQRGPLFHVSVNLPQYVQTCGAAVDQATLADYLEFDYPHRLVYVMDAYRLSDADRQALERKTSRPGVRAFRFAVDGAPVGEPANAEELPLPCSAAAWRALLKSHGVHLYADEGSFFRRRGDVIAYSTGKTGHHVLRLRPEESGVTELFTGRRFDGTEIGFDTSVPQAYLFKVGQDRKRVAGNTNRKLVADKDAEGS